MLKVSEAHLLGSIEALAAVGAIEGGGNARLALTDEDKTGRDLVVGWMRELGLDIRIDAIGNVIGVRAGRENGAAIMTGSHIDTVRTGGRYDGNYGVLAGLEVVRALNEARIVTRRPIAVAFFTNEEGARFQPDMMGSLVYAGGLGLNEAYAAADKDGMSVGDELRRIGYLGSTAPGALRPQAFLELHIEQGPILEAESKDIGIVTGVQAMRWYEVTITGQDAHTGATPMPLRKNALLGAARIVELVNSIGLKNAPLAVATVGMLNPYPNSRNVIPGEVFMTVDFRHPEDDTLSSMDAALQAGVKEIAEKIGLTYEMNQVFYYKPVAFDKDCVEAVRRAAKHFGYTHRDIVSGAGHDACYIARVAPTSMIFTPCVDGISHNEAEDISQDWAAMGTNVLMHAVLEKAEVIG